MKAGIAVDDWKLPVFRKRLADAGYTYEDAGSPTPGITILTVVFDSLPELDKVVRGAQDECAKTGPLGKPS